MGSVFQTDGMVGLFNARGYEQSNSKAIAFPGHVNEIFRGFRKESIEINSYDDCTNYYKLINFYDTVKIMKPNIIDYFDNKFLNRTKYLQENNISPMDAVDLYFQGERLPNWTGYLMRTDGYWQSFLHVFNNDNLVKMAYILGNEQREIERFHFEIMKRTDPWLVECPFGVQSWNKKLLRYAGGLNIANEPVKLPDNMNLHGSWQHIINESSDFRLMLWDIISSYDNSEIWDYYDKAKIEKDILTRKFSYIPMIQIYGFINLFFYYHNVELPMRIKLSKDSTPKTKFDIPIKVENQNTIYKLDEKGEMISFKSYEELVSSGLASKHRVLVSDKVIKNINNSNNKLDLYRENQNLKKEIGELKEEINNLKSSVSYRLENNLINTSYSVKKIVKIPKTLVNKYFKK